MRLSQHGSRPSPGRGLAFLLAASVAATGCKVYEAPSTPSPTPAAPSAIAVSERGRLTVGTADIDITPAPGLSLLGPGRAPRRSEGTLLRLHCQVFYFEYHAEIGGRVETLALVPCDLGTPSLLLQRRVAERLRGVVPIGTDRLIMPATHTSGGPAHYLGSLDRASGSSDAAATAYSDEVTEFLAERITDGIVRAHSDAMAPHDGTACIGWAQGSIRDRNHPVKRFGKNRNLEAFLANRLTREEEERFADDDRPAQMAVDGTLSVLRIDRCNAEGHSYRSLGAFAVHGAPASAMSETSTLYHGDIPGYAAREAVARYMDRFPCPTGEGAPEPCFIVGLANGVSGDLAPEVDARGPREARRAGASLADEVMKLWLAAEGSLTSDAPLRVGYRELDLPRARVEASNSFYDPLRREVYAYPGDVSRCGTLISLETARASAPTGCNPRLCDEPSIGASTGTSDEARLRMGPWGATENALDVTALGCQAPKLEPPRRFASPESDLPRVAPISIAYLGDRILTTLPAEVTTLAGHRARRQLERWLESKGRADLGHVVEMTLTGEDLHAITTHAEYDTQEGEGANVLYGPDSALFFANQELCLARWLLDEVDAKSDGECTLGQPPPGLVRPVIFRPAASTEAHPNAACDPSDNGTFVLAITPDRAFSQRPDGSHCSPDIRRFSRDGEHGWTVRWRPPPSCGERWAQPRARIVEEAGHEIATDDGDGLEARWVEGEWRVSWLPNRRERSRLGSRAFHFELRLDSKSPDRGRAKRPAHVERSEPIDPRCL